MARSKFPGKPSKPVNKTRINVLPTATEEVEDSIIISLPNDLKLVNNETCAEVVEISTESNTNILNTQRAVRRKRVCKRLIARRNSLTKLRHINTTSTLNSQKFKGCITDQAHTRKKTDNRLDRDVLNNRKLDKVKQALESGNIVGKFVLPVRSVHSSRVIKPNKRFINVEAVNSVRTFKKRVVNKKNNTANLAIKSTCSVQNEESVENPRTPCSTRRIILRQARLQLHTQTPIGPEGPFSANTSSNTSPPGTVTCGVCGAVRFYRFVKQARKFNIYSCESCRKFISKMIKRQMCSKKVLEVQCLKGQGACHVPPIVRSQHWKFRCAYKARCNACWLKMCLKSFQIPTTLKSNLLNLLPKFMRESDTLFNNSLSLFSFHTNNKSDINPTCSMLPDSTKAESLQPRRRPLRRNVVKNLEKSSLSPVFNVKRQKIDFKGPRVKHVCRSASIVLGQPIAIFQDEANSNRVESTDVELRVLSVTSEHRGMSTTAEQDTSDNKENEIVPQIQSVEAKLMLNNSTEPEIKVSLAKLPAGVTSSTTTKREKDKILKPLAIPIAEDTSRKRQRCIENNICVDFWENYDLDEIFQNGFGLTSSVPFPMPAICFLCGSAGSDPLLFCCLCCEPYHPFCLEQAPQNINANDKCYDWVCPKCTMCSSCGQTDKQKFNCQKCHKAYHLECFNTNRTVQIEDRPKVCSTCLRCRSCGKSNTKKFIGNTPLCLMCFRLRNKGNFCPICQRCYDDNDYDTKMMECGKCKKWIHSKCEGLSEEQYQILSLLPESIEFLCRLCESKPVWCKAVELELKSSFSTVLRLLSKNQIARNILKWSPVCCSPRNNKNILSARKLQFSDGSDLSDFDDDDDRNKLHKRYKCKEFKIKLEEMPVVSDDKVPLKTITITDIKNKLSSNEYFSLKEFNENMKEIVEFTKSAQLMEIYCTIIKQVFPWYDSNQKDSDILNTSLCDASQDSPKLEDNNNVFDYRRFKITNTIDVDVRACSLCKGIGDGLHYKEGRLLYCGNNEWVHGNCALWSSEVYEEIDGSLQNVQSAINRGRLLRCTQCKLKGASIGCCAKSCHETYHFICAQTVKCHFMQDNSIYCPSHNVIKNSAVISSSSDFAINRSIYVELDKKKKRFIESKNIQFMVGSLCITSIGSIAPLLSDNLDAIIPLNLSCRRLFWSTKEPWRLVTYTITTNLLKPQTSDVVNERNFTVDHTLSKIVVERKLKEVFLWQKDLENACAESSETDYDEEPQNEKDADILSPELRDAILEELPHDLLDGISMQDILPKLLTNDELLDLNLEQNKKLTYSDDASKGDFQQVFNTSKISKIRNQRRPCGVTLTCKQTKKIKSISSEKMFLHLLQVDGAYDNSSSSDSESEDWDRDITDQPVKCERCQCTYRTQASYKRHLESCEVISTSESDSEMQQEQEEIQSFVENDPYTVTSFESYTMQAEVREPAPVVSQSSEMFLAEQKYITEPQISAQIVVNQQPLEHIVSNEMCVSQPQQYYISQANCSSMVNQPSISILPTPITINRAPQPPLQLNIQPAPVMNLTAAAARPMLAQKVVRPRVRPKIIPCKKNRPIESKTYYIPPGNIGAPPVVVQQLPSANMIPTFLETFQQQTGQNLQYITTITPQIANQTPIMHFQPDNLLNFVSGVQPTVILPQPRVLTDSLMVDNNGSLVWAPQPAPQPIYYGFETIVQNTVLQSQQFLPGTVPGLLTANSSYSSTTQVFQTSKVESVLDVSSGNIVFLNSAPVVNSQPIQVTPHPPPVTNPPLVIQETKPTVSWNYIEPTPEPPPPAPQPEAPKQIPLVQTSNSNANSINLPIAPFIPEPGIPTNIVPPTPKPIVTSHARPMNRVLPMPTSNLKPPVNPPPPKKPIIVQKCEQPLEKPKLPKIKIVGDIVIKPSMFTTLNKPIEPCAIKEPIKETFQETKPEKVYKVHNFIPKKTPPVQVAPLKPIKLKITPEQVAEKPKPEPKVQNDKQNSAILYTIETQDGFHCSSNSVQDLWSKVFDAVQEARINCGMPSLPPGALNSINGLQILGLKSNALKYLIEQLPGAGKCVKYRPTFHHRATDLDLDDEFDLNLKDGIKCTPYITSQERSDMFGWLASKHRKLEAVNFNDFEMLTRRGSVINLPMATRYRNLQLTSKQSVGVYRSIIHKRGLFCRRDIESGEMVIEYAGEVIRSILADIREKQYIVKGIGCYMFRIDENFVVDATMKGNAARFINHSCEPNCYSRIMEILGHKHIIIFALRKIQCGEELTYDYKFPFEEDKIPCSCGSRRCRKFLN